MIKYIKIFIIILTCAFFIVGCNSKEPLNDEGTPKDTVVKFLECYVKNDIDGMRKYSLNSNTMLFPIEYENFFDNVEISLNSFDFFDDFYNNSLVFTISSKIKYTVISENIKDNSATVTVSIDAPNMTGIFQEIMSNKSILSFNEAELHSLIYDEILTYNHSTNNDLQFDMQQIDGKWLIDLENFNVMDTLSGGLLSGYKNIHQIAINELKQQIEAGEQQ